MNDYTFLTRKETAEHLGGPECQISERQIERWVAQGRLGYVRMGNRTLHTPEQIEAFVAANTVEAANTVVATKAVS